MYNHLCSQECVCVFTWRLEDNFGSYFPGGTLLFYVYECSACMNLYEPGAFQKRMFDTLKLARQFQVAMWVLGIECRSSGRAIASTKPSLCFPI